MQFFTQTVRDMVESRIGGFKNELDAILDADPKIKEAFKTGNKNKLIPAQKKELKKALTHLLRQTDEIRPHQYGQESTTSTQEKKHLRVVL